MKVIWAEDARLRARETATYICEMFGARARQKFLSELSRIDSLLTGQPNLGAAEPLLSDAPVLYRALVVGRRNKIVYHVHDDVVEVVDLWDTRREPKQQAGGIHPEA